MSQLGQALSFYVPNTISAVEFIILLALATQKHRYQEQAMERGEALEKAFNKIWKLEDVYEQSVRIRRDADSTRKEHYGLVEKNILQNKLGEFQSFPEFQGKYDDLKDRLENSERLRRLGDEDHQELARKPNDTKIELDNINEDKALLRLEISSPKIDRDDNSARWGRDIDSARRDRENPLQKLETLSRVTCNHQRMWDSLKIKDSEISRLRTLLTEKTTWVSRLRSRLDEVSHKNKYLQTENGDLKGLCNQARSREENARFYVQSCGSQFSSGGKYFRGRRTDRGTDVRNSQQI